MEPCKQAVPARIPPFPPPPCQTLANGRPGRDFNGILGNRSPAFISGIFPEIRATGPGNCPIFWNGARKKGRLPAARFLPGNSRSRRPGPDFLRSSKGRGRKQQNLRKCQNSGRDGGWSRMRKIFPWIAYVWYSAGYPRGCIPNYQLSLSNGTRTGYLLTWPMYPPPDLAGVPTT